MTICTGPLLETSISANRLHSHNSSLCRVANYFINVVLAQVHVDEDPGYGDGAGGAAGQGGRGDQALPAGPRLHPPQRPLQVRIGGHQEALTQHHRSFID